MTANPPAAQSANPRLKPPEKRVSWLRDDIEAVVVALIIALLIRQYVTEAFVIPTGSMAPTLLGAHADLVCTNCGMPQPISEPKYLADAPAIPADANATGACPKCGRIMFGVMPADAGPGTTKEVPCDNPNDHSHGIVMLHRLAAPIGRGDKAVEATCMNCRARFLNRLAPEYWPRGSISRGDRILVDKTGGRFEAPERFQVHVFKWPLDPNENYIKRLVGLPDETIDVKNGNFYANGKIARKPADVQRQVWVPVHESRHVEMDPGEVQKGDGSVERKRAFRAEGGTADFTSDRKGWTLTPAEGTTATAWIVYDRPITDWNAYNHGQPSASDHVVGDVRVACKVSARPGWKAIVVQLLDSDRVIEARIQPQLVCIWAGDSPETAAPSAPIDLAVPHAIAVWRADGRAVLELDGKELVTWEFEPSTELTRRSDVRLGVEGAGATFDDIEIDRDIYYWDMISGQASDLFPFHVPPGHYFFMGDNSGNSNDSRVWGTVPEGHLVGRAFSVFWPSLPGDFAVRRIR